VGRGSRSPAELLLLAGFFLLMTSLSFSKYFASQTQAAENPTPKPSETPPAVSPSLTSSDISETLPPAASPTASELVETVMASSTSSEALPSAASKTPPAGSATTSSSDVTASVGPPSLSETATEALTEIATVLPTDEFTATGTRTATSSETVPALATAQATDSATALATATSTASASETGTASATIVATSPVSPSPFTESATPTQTLTPSSAPTPYPPLSVRFNEIAWAGTAASANDEWIELFNASGDPIPLDGWVVSDGGDIQIDLSGSIGSHAFIVLERTDESTLIDIGAHQIYTGSLNNGGETLRLIDPSGTTIDTANQGGGAWPAGEAATRSSMERGGSNWHTFSGVGGNGHDANGAAIQGTPGQPNSSPLVATPTAPESATPSGSATPAHPQSLLINEVAWAGTLASASDEWIELYNPGTGAISLDGWRLTDGGDVSIYLSGVIGGRGYFVLERSDDSTIANIQGGSWPAGDATSHASMEREGGGDLRGNWETFTGYHGVGHDQSGNSIRGTPGTINSLHLPTPIPYIPGAVRINEVLIRPHYDWEGTGGVDTGDEFIEGLLVDEISYLKVRAYNLSYGRFPDGSGHLQYGLWPTPNEANLPFDEGFIPAETGFPSLCPDPGEVRVFLLRHARHPSQTRWLRESGFGICD
jgi:hypothetical protein